jgi:Flp pilus assembly protein TadB
MQPLAIAEIIQLILAPVVMITACGLLLTSLGNRYAAVTNRLRSLSQEHFDLLQKPEQPDVYFDFTQERIQQIESQIPELLRHHQALHCSLLIIYVAIAFFLTSMFILAGAAMVQWVLLEVLSLLVFLAGILSLFTGVLLTAIDFRKSHLVTENEVRRICRLTPPGRKPWND